MTTGEALARDDKRITKNLWDYMEKADIICAHNGKAFDITRVNTQFLVHGFGQPAPYKVIDTCLVARKYFAFEHNTLDALADRLGVTRKTPVDNSLWIRCEAGDKKALAEMLAYNKNDVGVLEEVYVKLRPWIKDHPNLALFHDVAESKGAFICRTCTSTDLIMIGDYATSVNTYDSYRCNSCGAIMRSRRASTSLKKDTHILQGIS
jgi:DNA polymerase III epsilon subunit-like protein